MRRVRDTGDRRRIDVELTPEGHTRWMAGMEALAGAESAIVQALEPAEREQVNALLKKMLLRAEELADGASVDEAGH